jgi:hypothetical protein
MTYKFDFVVCLFNEAVKEERNFRVIKSRKIKWKRHAELCCRREMHTGYYGKPKESNQLEEQGVDKRIILKLGLKKQGWKGVDWIHLVHDREKVRAIVSTTLMQGRVP